ncbi:Bud13 [Penicillium bovifimosum]|uniref:Bud13 n=1 Tax=Penicillium bovifimosum TaxID=126998 RepID=A0A9W9GUA6_9EURO|nr:Bud13 [Penicillium bovifimosum]KAJ5130036.1 Bud13 [Penicillium bovifimosum]
MPGSLAEYLAKNYLTADPAIERPKKKRKKTKAIDTASSGLIIADDDPPDIRSTLGVQNQDDEDRPYFETSANTAEFRRTKKSNWKTIGGPAPGQGGSEQAAADAILADAAAERAAQQDADDDEAPMIEDEDDGAGRMESGARAGLQTAAQTAAMVKAQEKRRKAEEAQFRDPAAAKEKTQETIYRDASGRIINVAMKRAEARRAEEEKRVQEEKAREALMGDVQLKQREARRQELQDIKAMPVARTIEDEDINEEMRARDRWNDPAAEFLTARREKGASMTGRPLYQGAFQPNRYGIRPGHRWDGVDRGNGFEKDWFAARNKKSRLATLEYQWQMDE